MTMIDETTETTEITGGDAERFIAAIRAVAVARSTDTGRPTVLTNVYLEHTPDDGIRVTATDSYRLAQVSILCDATLPLGAWLIDAETVTGLAKAASATLARRGAIRSLTLTWHNDQLATISVVVNGALSTWTNRPIGTFPDYRRLLPVPGIIAADMIAWNPRYLADTAKIATELGAGPKDEPTVRLVSMAGTGKPSGFEVHTSQAHATYWLMPVRVA